MAALWSPEFGVGVSRVFEYKLWLGQATAGRTAGTSFDLSTSRLACWKSAEER